MTKKYFGQDFVINKFSALDGETTISYKVLEGDFEARVTKKGMTLHGHLEKPIDSEAKLQDFAKFISDVWQDQRKLAPKIAMHSDGFKA